MNTVVVLFTRDLRVHDNPALSAACRSAERVVPLYVDDPARPMTPNRRAFLLEALADLRDSLRDLGGDLLIRRGGTVAETLQACREVGADGVDVADDFGVFEGGLRTQLRKACDSERIALRTLPGTTVVPPGSLRPSGGGDHYKVFTPYWRAWTSAAWRRAEPAPDRVRLPEGVGGDDPVQRLGPVAVAADLPTGGESAGLDRLDRWSPFAERYAELHDDLAADGTSRLSPYLAFGCVSPLVTAADERVPDAMARQLCWRDFHHQVLAAFPKLTEDAYRPRVEEDWAYRPDELEAWRHGATGVDIVDAGMRQLTAEGWMHNRARLICASYMTRTLGLDWREGAAWFAAHLVDCDDANNWGNWQWVAGTGNDTKPYRRFNAERQAARFDPEEAYRRRWAAEAA